MNWVVLAADQVRSKEHKLTQGGPQLQPGEDKRGPSLALGG